MDTLNKSLEKVSTGVPSKPSIFTFMPVVRKLPIEAIITQDGRSGALTGRPHKNIAASHVETTAESMSDEEFFKAEKVFIKECVEGGAGNMIQTGTKLQFKPSPDHVSLSQTKASPSVDARSQNTSNHVTAGTASMETAVDKHRDISRRPCPDASRHAEVSSGFFANRLSEDRASPTDSGDMFPTPASSRESILSERSWSAAQTHKIKLSYKSLAAIPTNTLLLDQQAIDEQVERGESPCDMTDGGVTLDRGVVDTHAEMCSPAQLRQQSEELYAVIDEILANSIPESKASRSLQSSRSSTPGLQQNTSSSPKSLGRETKYASLCSLHPPTSLERNLIDRKKTKPGVIRPMTAIPRLTVDDEEEFHPNPFRQFNDKRTFTDNSKVVARKDLHTSSKGRMWREERKPERRTPFSVCDLQITEPEDQISRPVKTSFSPTEGRLEAFETHI
ncbi:muscular LMNA-interacting protein isoform X6 [Sparus aurata]|uniref:muscular LMNA-interacting protein isoform X6 n=1 Tax=Sparus aurata TaxID=8175 RepID=UPI0011C11565|nr:muscular LMNA-interacting protein isoform X6 [Sparus aurata]